MSVAYEPRNFINDGNYPSIGDPHDVPEIHEVQDVVHEKHEMYDVHDVQGVHDAQEVHVPEVHDVSDVPDVTAGDHTRFDENDVATELAAVVGFNSTTPLLGVSEADARMVDGVDGLPAPAPVSPQETSPTPVLNQRIKPIPKPEREPTKNLEGKFVCRWPNCTEEVRVFSRRCEWSKHMDKHDRPYKCTAEGCEKLPGFTYSGGLLRHEREVHDKHGGPKNPLHCPHPTCKRHSGKGFSRQENLNEHLRRVHTQTGVSPNPGDTDDAGSPTAAGGVNVSGGGGGGGGGGSKRKRVLGFTEEAEEMDLREEMKRAKLENEELRRQVEAQNQQMVAMMQQIAQLQEAVQARIVQTQPALM